MNIFLQLLSMLVILGLVLDSGHAATFTTCRQAVSTVECSSIDTDGSPSFTTIQKTPSGTESSTIGDDHDDINKADEMSNEDNNLTN